MRPFPQSPDSLLSSSLPITLSVCPPLVRTHKSQDLFYKDNTLIISGGAEAQTIHRFKKDLDKSMDERTLVANKKGRMEREVWNLDRKTDDVGLKNSLSLRYVWSTCDVQSTIPRPGHSREPETKILPEASSSDHLLAGSC